MARLKAWLRRTDDDLELEVYWLAAVVGFVVEVPFFIAGGLPPIEIAYAVAMSLFGALGVCMLVELWLHFWD